MIKRILIYGFPFFLLFIEAILREALSQGVNTSVGPSLAATGVGFLISLIVPKKSSLQFSPETERELKERKMSAMSTAERRFIDFVWLFAFLLTALWTYDVYISYKSPTLAWFGFPALLIIGFVNYFIGIVFSEVKEVV